MKSEGAVRRKLQQVLFRYLKQRLALNFQKLPQTCGFNGKPTSIRLPRMCLYGANFPGSWQGKVCDVDVEGGVEQARGCPYWKPRRSKEEIKAEFNASMSRNRAVVAAEYPDAAALLWVLDEETAPGDFDTEEEGVSEEGSVE